MSDESCWLDWPALSALPAAPRVDGTPGPVVVLAAHPDDEVLALGGALAQHRWADVRFCTATDGEASHPGSPTVSPDELARVRRLELSHALTQLGYEHVEVSWFGLPDSALATRRDDLEQLVRKHTQDAALVLCPLSYDGHPDHDVLGETAAKACADRVPLWQFPVWTWDWAAPEDPRVQWETAYSMPVDDRARTRKQTAVQCFVSQICALSDDPADRAVLSPEMLAHFDRPFEVVFR
ncbi:MAG TPA: PIG-L family deacetylase [Nocardioidaceae bacterium]|nr:PIG-L family deacetylase [Nocardioidaceae bacterium]